VLLPAALVPSHYNITVDLDLDNFVFSGVVEISVHVVGGKSFQLHSLDLEYGEGAAALHYEEGGEHKSLQVTTITIDKKSESATFECAHDMPANTNATLIIKYNGHINDKMCGLYRSQYKDAAGNKKYCACTQMEPTDCRRMIPCIDEPARKATFDVTVVYPSHMIALSNMPVKATSALSDTRLRTSFDTTPKMSTYLLALVVGEFDYVESKTNAGVQVRVYTEKGKKSQGNFALDMACKTLDFFNEYFAIEYPLPKSDMVAISDFAAGQWRIGD